MQDLATGRVASWNSDASLLAASAVKLGVMIEALLLTRFQAIGAVSTTFLATYRLSQARRLDALAPPPLVTWRCSTPRNLGRIIRVVQAAALGDADARRRTGLALHEATLGLALAQKTDWTAKARHVAAIVHAPDGPKIVVVVTYRPQPGSTVSRGRCSSLARPATARNGGSRLSSTRRRRRGWCVA